MPKRSSRTRSCARIRALGKDDRRAARGTAAAAVALHDHAQRHAQPVALEASDERRARCAGRSRRAAQRHAAKAPSSPKRSSSAAADMVLVEQALLQLPMHLRAAATLRFIEGRSHPEIAEILNQPIGTVKSHVHRAVRILRRILGPASRPHRAERRGHDMRCCDVEALWDEMRDGVEPRREHVLAHLRRRAPLPRALREYEGVAYCLSCLPVVEPPVRLVPRILDHIKSARAPPSCEGRRRRRASARRSAISRRVPRRRHHLRRHRPRRRRSRQCAAHVERRLRRPVRDAPNRPTWCEARLERYFATWTTDPDADRHLELTAVRASRAAQSRARFRRAKSARTAGSLARSATRMAARAVGQAMARNPVALLFPCHRVVDATGGAAQLRLRRRDQGPHPRDGRLPQGSPSPNAEPPGITRPRLLQK